MTGRRVRVLELRSVRGTGGGPEKTILAGAARADRSHFDIVVCYLRDARDTVFSVDDYARRMGVRYHEVVERSSFDFSAWGELRRLVRSEAVDIVHAHEYKTDLIAWWLARQEACVPLATVHGWTGHSARERLVYYPIDKRLLARFPCAIAVSSDIRDVLLRAGAKPERVITVLNGIDAEVFRRQRSEEPRLRAAYGIPAGELVIGSVGRLERQKRFDLLIEAVARIRERLADRRITLLIAGEGSQREPLAQAIAQQNLAGACRLIGHDSDVISLHHVFDLFVQSSDYEGTPNAVLEAMALETPVVATDAGGTRELLRPDLDGMIVPCGNVGALVDAMARTIEDPAATSRRVACARSRVEGALSFEARTRRVEGIYAELTAGRRGLPIGKDASA
jgi:glycosyltransferase involved in cell wall biosynthesis